MKNLSELAPSFINHNLSEDEPDFTHSNFTSIRVPGKNAQDHTDAVKSQRDEGKLLVETNLTALPPEIIAYIREVSKKPGDL